MATATTSTVKEIDLKMSELEAGAVLRVLGRVITAGTPEGDASYRVYCALSSVATGRGQTEGSLKFV